VDAGPAHLRALREIIYPVLKPERDRAFASPAGFQLLQEDPLQFSAALRTPEAIADLLLMTPHLFRATAEGKAKAAALQSLDLEVDVRVQRFERQAY